MSEVKQRGEAQGSEVDDTVSVAGVAERYDTLCKAPAENRT